MNIVIIGIGRLGRTVVEQLSKEGHDIVVIDNDKKTLEKTINDFDVIGLLGNGANYDIQNAANVETADLLIVCTSSDELNILCCMVAKKLGQTDTIARIRNPEYFNLFMGRDLGLNMMVNPDYEGAMEVFRILRSPGTIKTEPFAKGKVDLVEFKLTNDNPLINKPITEISSNYKLKMLVCAIQRDKEVIIPNGDTILRENDKIYVVTSAQNVYLILKNLGINEGIVKNVFIIGGGNISYYLAKKLIGAGLSVKIIEKNETKSLELSESLPEAEIVLGDASEQEILLEEGLLKADAVIILTGSDEENIMISLFASSHKAKKVITKINKLSYYSMLETSGVESIISPRLLTADHIIRYVRSKQNSFGSSVLNLYSIVNDKAEALEFKATESFKGLNTPLRELKIKKNLIIACILRGDEVITPQGPVTIEAGDNVIIVTTNEFLNDLDDILKD